MTPPRVWIVHEKDNLIVNKELVRLGFAFVRKGARTPPDVTDDLIALENAAREQGLRIYKSRPAVGTQIDDNDNGDERSAMRTPDFVAEFEPLDFDTKIRYGDDGGKSVLVSC